jgi:hypothetical protein
MENAIPVKWKKAVMKLKSGANDEAIAKEEDGEDDGVEVGVVGVEGAVFEEAESATPLESFAKGFKVLLATARIVSRPARSIFPAPCM